MCLFSFSSKRFWSSLGLRLVAQNDREFASLWVFVSSDILNFQIILSHSQYVTASFDLTGIRRIVSFVYTSTSHVNRQFL